MFSLWACERFMRFGLGTFPVFGRCSLVLMEVLGFVPDRIQGCLEWASFRFGMSRVVVPISDGTFLMFFCVQRAFDDAWEVGDV